jgi:predicted nucleic acid-binding protein
MLTASRQLLDSALRLSFELNHPVYDCVYIALALWRNIPLVTADKRLAAAVRQRPKLAAFVTLLTDLPD